MIGIVTQALGYNYGGILQNYALQQVLKKLGYESITLDVFYRYPYSRYLISNLRSHIFNAVGIKHNYPKKPFHGRSIPEVTGRFMLEHLKLTEPLDDYSPKVLDKYHIDTIIFGSDQIWRPSYNPNIENMFGAFATKTCRKIAYAASFGTDVWEYSKEQTERCRVLLKDFSAVSVREETAVSLCEEYLEYKEAKHVLDPTLLLDKEDYLKLCQKVSPSTTAYIAAYILDNNSSKTKLLQQLSDSYHLPIKFISAHDHTELSIEEWLAVFRDASYVVTDSFHGTVFSIIFQKQFIVIPNGIRGHSRFISLLNGLGLDATILGEFLGIDIEFSSIDWGIVEKKLQDNKLGSYNFLKYSFNRLNGSREDS